MASLGGPNIITSGLVLALDAANTKSYPGSGTTWRDLSGNNNTGTLVGTPTFNSNPNSFTFASNKNITTTLSNIALSAATFIAWVYPTQTQGTYTGLIFNRTGYGGSTAPATGLDFFTNNSVGYTWNNTVATYTWNSGLTTPINQWSMVAVTVNSTTAVAYLCQASGITSSTNTTTHAVLSGMNFFIACDPLDTSLRTLIGNLSTSLIYNRALSSQEVLQNYNATKARFNLS
jgi:hypothetical protein